MRVFYHGHRADAAARPCKAVATTTAPMTIDADASRRCNAPPQSHLKEFRDESRCISRAESALDDRTGAD
jgi:hypothetical protein